jgi:hypothetical protein
LGLVGRSAWLAGFLPCSFFRLVVDLFVGWLGLFCRPGILSARHFVGPAFCRPGMGGSGPDLGLPGQVGIGRPLPAG